MDQYQTTDLFTEEPVVYAGFWERFGALFLDSIILLVISVAMSFIMPDDRASNGAIGIAVDWLYFALQESSEAQATFGKRAVGIKVTTTNGQRISFGRATGRYFAHFLSAFLLFIGYLMVIWDRRKQALHDKIADTLVVKAQ